MTNVTKNVMQRTGQENTVESYIVHYIQMGAEKMQYFIQISELLWHSSFVAWWLVWKIIDLLSPICNFDLMQESKEFRFCFSTLDCKSRWLLGVWGGKSHIQDLCYYRRRGSQIFEYSCTVLQIFLVSEIMSFPVGWHSSICAWMYGRGLGLLLSLSFIWI